MDRQRSCSAYHRLWYSLFSFLKYQEDNAAIIRYGLLKCCRITRPVLGAEFYAFIYCLDYVLALEHDLSDIIRRNFSTHMISDFKILLDAVTKYNTVSEKRLLINSAALHKNYTSFDLFGIAHVNCRYIIANIVTNSRADELLDIDLVNTGKLYRHISQ